ncbi:MAG: 1-acyl-sn-glycerol-3-phosphate acyltransferase, partial [Candidatus Riflebacteria bacterium]|nr:1-acyl-sn-glycerol-3-phosphate acyltransferase [Candidatus Riflebacteria bacterium]
MLEPLRWLLWLFSTFVLSLRYRVKVIGLESVRGLKKALILPNHPAYADPALVIQALWPSLRPRPMLLASMFRHPLISWVPRLLDAVEVPDLEQASAEARRQAEASVRAVIDGLSSGRSHILWPAGRAYHTAGRESLAATRSASEILTAVPDAEVVLVRTRGLWGSSFSYARTGRPPDLPGSILGGIGVILSNLIFFTPRREVEITIERLDRSALPGLTREILNPFLESWYNRPGEEKPRYVPYHFLFGPRDHAFPPLGDAVALDLSRVKRSTGETIAQMVSERLRREPGDAERDPASRLEDLGLDSLDRMEIALEVERRFGFSSEEVPLTIGSLWALAEGLAKTGGPAPAPPAWFERAGPAARPSLLGSTLARAFVARALASGSRPADADDTSGLVTYRRLLVGASLLARRFARYPEPNVGVLLPASVAADMVFFALHLAGKLPVMLNFTTGPAGLGHAAWLTGLRHVITSRRFVDRTNIRVQGTESVYLEELR